MRVSKLPGEQACILEVAPQHRLACNILNNDKSLPCIVLLNGSVFNFRQWDTVVRAGFIPLIGTKFRLVRYDYGPSGCSSTPHQGWSLENLAAELLLLLNALGVERAHLYGLSKGTIVAQALQLWHPQRVASLAGYGWYYHHYSRLGPFRRQFERRLERFEGLKALWEKELDWSAFQEVWREVYREIVFGKSVEQFSLWEKASDYFLQLKLFPVMAPTRIGIMHAWFRYALQEMQELTPLFKDMRRICGAVPTLLQHAAKDETLPIEMARELKAELPFAELIEYDENYSHLSVAFKRRHAAQVIQDYIEFLNRATRLAPGARQEQADMVFK